MRKVELPKMAKEEAEATFMVVFTTPLKGFGLVNTPTHTHTQNKDAFVIQTVLHAPQ